MDMCLLMLFSFQCDDVGHLFMSVSLFIETKYCLEYVCFKVNKHVTFTESNSFEYFENEK